MANINIKDYSKRSVVKTTSLAEALNVKVIAVKYIADNNKTDVGNLFAQTSINKSNITSISNAVTTNTNAIAKNTSDIITLKSIGSYKGTFATAAARDAAIPSPLKGDYVLVGTAAPYQEYIFETTWEQGGIVSNTTAVNLDDYYKKIETYSQGEVDTKTNALDGKIVENTADITTNTNAIATNVTNIGNKQNAIDAGITVAGSNGNVVIAINTLNTQTFTTLPTTIATKAAGDLKVRNRAGAKVDLSTMVGTDDETLLMTASGAYAAAEVTVSQIPKDDAIFTFDDGTTATYKLVK